MNTSAINSNKFVWLLRREFWEYRGGMFWAPVIVALVTLGFTLIVMLIAEFSAHQHGIRLGGMNLDHVVDSIGAGDVAKVRSAIDLFLVAMSIPIGMTFIFVVFFYLLGSLYNDRVDRSVLFWKSLPLSDTETVLAKVVTAALVAPVLTVAATIFLHLGLLILLSLYAVLHSAGHALLLLWSPVHLIALWLKFCVSIPVNALWALPTIGWLLLCSSYARSKPFLWAVMLPILSGVIISCVNFAQTFSFSGWYWQIVGRILLSLTPYSWLTKVTLADTRENVDDDLQVLHHVLSFDNIGSALVSPNLWIGAAAGVAMIAGAIWLRRTRVEAYA